MSGERDSRYFSSRFGYHLEAPEGMTLQSEQIFNFVLEKKREEAVLFALTGTDEESYAISATYNNFFRYMPTPRRDNDEAMREWNDATENWDWYHTVGVVVENMVSEKDTLYRLVTVR